LWWKKDVPSNKGVVGCKEKTRDHLKDQQRRTCPQGVRNLSITMGKLGPQNPKQGNLHRLELEANTPDFLCKAGITTTLSMLRLTVRDLGRIQRSAPDRLKVHI
jgi:hypothetical protein